MRLKRLELQGFKSFLDRTILSFDDSITGVVGPNGCGKSNIVDAILWVMGEQSPKHLRGESMTDVIFNGSDTKNATSMAEVSLILDRRGVALAPQFAAFEKGEEIQITRRIYRDGTGEYLINKSKCRLKDVHELFMDTGVGRRAYSIIEQGQIDRMINVKPEDRRAIFEEVAGITKYKAKRKEAERKLESTGQNLLRLQDIINELEKRIRSLKGQATRAQKYKEFKSELETIDLFLLGRKFHTRKKEITEVRNQKDEWINKRSSSDARLGEVDAKVTELEVSRVDEEKGIQVLSEKERELSLQIQRLESEWNLLDQRRGHLQDSLKNSETEETELAEHINALDEERSRIEDQLRDLDQSLVDLDGEIEEQERKLSSFHDDKEQAERRRRQFSQELSQATQHEVTLSSRVEHAGQKRGELQGRREELNQKMTGLVVSLDEFASKLETAESKISECAERSENAEAETEQLHTECQQASRRLSEVENELFEARETYHGKNSRYESLKELQENLEGYSPTAKEILLKLEGSDIRAVPLAEILKPDASIEDHLEALLGDDVNTLIVSKKTDAIDLSRLVNEKDLERVRIFSVEDARQAAVEAPKPIEGAESILTKVRVESDFEAVAKCWLGKVYICRDADQLFQLRESHPDSVFLTNDSRTIAHADRSLTSGNIPKKTGVFARRREIEELEVVCSDLQNQLDQKTQERENQLLHLKEQEQLRTEMKDKLSSIHVESVEYRKEKEQIQLDRDRTDREYTALVNESERNLAQLDELQVQEDTWKKELEALSSSKELLANQVTQAETEIQSLEDSYATLGESVGEKRVERSGLREKANSFKSQLTNIEGDVNRSSQRRESIRAQRSRETNELEQIDGNQAEVKSQSVEAEKSRNETLVLLSDSRERFNDICRELQELREELTALHREREQIVTKVQELELSLAQKEADLVHLQETSLERYNEEIKELDENAKIDVEKLPLFTAQLEVTFELLLPHEQQPLLDQHAEDIRKKVSRYGEVNLTAIQEYEEIQQRYDFLMEQKTDLEKSIGILEEAITKINESTISRFEETFTAVQSKFREIFPILFNGGKAELKLTNTENPLDSGVDIMVQPPGKRLQSITLLSGGEKALTAVSLVLAIFARKPSPFCLLDEVDAPLDDANVSRFNTVIRKMSEKTQFIVITHNKKTMEITESLYGVTMERAGISKMASVRLS